MRRARGRRWLAAWLPGGRRRRLTLPPRQAYERWAASYGRQPNALQRLEDAALRRVLPPLAGLTVLDAGCGKARLAGLALDAGAARAAAVDLALPMIASRDLRRRAGLHRAVGAVGRLPFPDRSFDAVLCGLVLGHVADLPAALAALDRVLRPGGFLVLSDFHPFATLRGWERTFTDPASGRAFAVEQHPHLFADYVACFGRLGLTLEALEEPRWRGYPVAFALRARKGGEAAGGDG